MNWFWVFEKCLTARDAKSLRKGCKECLYYEIHKYGLFVKKEKALPLIYEDIKLDIGYRLIY